MCPVCLSSVAVLITRGVSGLGATAAGVAVVRGAKIATRISKIWKPRTQDPLQGLSIHKTKEKQNGNN
jgi:hypothetical protein